MPNPQDEKLVRAAVAGGHLTDEQGAEALAALREIEAFGGSASAVEVLVKRGMLGQQQAEALLAEAARASAASGPAASKPSGQLPRELGRFALLETMPMTAAIRRIVVKGGNALDIKKTALEEGMLTLRRCAILNALRGKTSLEEVLSVTMPD